MAEADSGQERTEKPTPKKLKKSREEGQIPRSRELNTTLAMLFAASGFVMVGDYMASSLIDLFQTDLTLTRETIMDTKAVTQSFAHNGLAALQLIGPFLAIMFISVFIGPAILGGFSFSTKALAPKWSKLNPISGLKRVFGPKGLVELVKALAKFILLFSMAILLFQAAKDDYLGLGMEPLGQAMIHGSQLFFWHFFALTAALLIIALLDSPYQLWTHHKKLRMSRQDIKQESKESDGNPEVKSRIRALQREISQRRMLEDIPTAQVILVNPTHFAVALRYQDGKENAPIMVAKGTDLIAFKIREIGEAHDVPIFTAPPLTRAIYYSTEIGQTIPTGLYTAVAKILAYLFQLKHATQFTPQKPEDFDIPKELSDLDRRNNRFER